MNNPVFAWSFATLAMSPDTIPNDTILHYTQKLGTVYNREITSLIVDPNNKGTLIVTLAGYDDENKVFLCPVANTSTSSNFSTNFRTIQGNLPKISVFTGVIDVTKPRKLIIGTESGVWSTTNYLPVNPVWEFNSTGVGAIPVTQIKQQQLAMDKYPNVENYGIFYMATYGGGIYIDSSSYVARVKNEVEPTDNNESVESMNINVYPNPVVSEINLAINMVQEGDVTVNIYNMAGQVIFTENIVTLV